MSVFGDNLRYLRKRNNLSQDEIADMFSYKSFTTVQKWENGDSEPNIEIVRSLANLFKVSMNDLTSVDIEHTPMQDLEMSPISEMIKSGYSTIRVVPFGGSCGNGVINDGSQKTIEYPTELLGKEKNEDEYFISYAKGISMEKAGIHDGDMLLFHEQPTLENNEIGFFTLNDEEYIKRFKKIKNGVMLVSESYTEDFEPMIISEDDQLTIRAKLYKVVKDFE